MQPKLGPTICGVCEDPKQIVIATDTDDPTLGYCAFCVRSSRRQERHAAKIRRGQRVA